VKHLLQNVLDAMNHLIDIEIAKKLGTLRGELKRAGWRSETESCLFRCCISSGPDKPSALDWIAVHCRAHDHLIFLRWIEKVTTMAGTLNDNGKGN
jgi:hypothetical protein